MENPRSKDDLRTAFFATGQSAETLQGRSLLADSIIRERFAQIPSPAFALAAMGGYGRCELFPHSDIDLLIGVPDKTQGAGSELSLFLRDLWDAGLRVSHTVRSPQECASPPDGNIPFSISLLDLRPLAGDSALLSQIDAARTKLVSRHQEPLTTALCALARTRRTKFHNSIYHLEPDLKEGPGTLRDLHLLHWLEKLGTLRVHAPLDEAQTFLATLRCWLHYQANRDSNILKFELQDELGSFPFLPFSDPAIGMQQFYRHARAVDRAADLALDRAETPHSGLLDLFREKRARLSNADFTVSRERVLLRTPSHLETDAHLPFRLLAFIGRHGLRPAPDTEERLRKSLAHWEQRTPAITPFWPVFEPVLQQPHAALAIRTMQRTGMLGVVLPEWQRIDCLVARDFYHRYTVDEHTLVTLDTLEEMAASTEPARARFAQLWKELERPALLRLALILHDIGKGEGEGRHAEVSEALSQEVFERWKVPEAEAAMVRFLVAKHLVLSSMMTSRDITDPATRHQLADAVGTGERLRYLTLMTYADISAVNPTAMSPWRLEQLWRVYVAADQELTRELETARLSSSAGHLAGFPVRYERTHTPQEIAAHGELLKVALANGVGLSLERHGHLWTATIAAPDRPYLLASLAGMLAAFGLSIEKAEAFANQEEVVLDTFVFSDPKRTLELNPQEQDRLRNMLQSAALGKIDVEKMLKGRRSTPGPRPVTPAVAVDHTASATATLFQITAADRPGLLYDVARAISVAGDNISVVLLETEAGCARDVFYVTRSGRKLTPEQADKLATQLRLLC